MVQRLSESYQFNPADPRAPSEEQWASMAPPERARVVGMLPADVPMELSPPEGDPHWNAKVKARSTLDEFFRRVGRKIYVSSELAVYYPNEPRFAPDVLAVLDVEPHERKKWVVADEGKGLDLVIEVHDSGDRVKDFELNVERYARLGIREYFIFDRGQLTLRGYRLPPVDDQVRLAKRRVYHPIALQGGVYTSQVLGLDLTLDGTKLRFLYGMAPVPEAEELVVKLQSMLDGLVRRAEEAEARAAAEAQRAAAEAERAAAEAERAAARATSLQAELLKGLKKGIESLCAVLDIELSPERLRAIDALDAAGLEALLMKIREDRRFPESP